MSDIKEYLFAIMFFLLAVYGFTLIDSAVANEIDLEVTFYE